MENVMPESKAGSTVCFAPDAQALKKQIEKDINDVKAAVAAKLDDRKSAAVRLLKRGRHTVEDGISEAAHTIKHHPFGFVAIAFAAGAAFGFLAPRYARK